jgi:hypothetical protein
MGDGAARIRMIRVPREIISLPRWRMRYQLCEPAPKRDLFHLDPGRCDDFCLLGGLRAQVLGEMLWRPAADCQAHRREPLRHHRPSLIGRRRSPSVTRSPVRANGRTGRAALPSSRPYSLETRVSLLVMNSRRAGLPSCVALMPRTIAALISPGCVTRSP